MASSETTRLLVEGITAIDDLVSLRTTVEKWVIDASDAVYRFKRKDGSFWKDSKSARDQTTGQAPHITTSARAYIALLYADRLRDTSKGRKPPKWHPDFARLVTRATVGRQGRQFFEALKNRSNGEKIDPYEFNTFDIAHLADFFQVSDDLARFYEISSDMNAFFKNTGGAESVEFDFDVSDECPVQNRRDTAEEYNRKSAREMVDKRLREAIGEAAGVSDAGVGFPGEVWFEEGRAESRHYFVTLHALRALHVLGATDINGLTNVVAGARSFAIEQSYYFQRGVTHRQDSIRLAFAGCIYAIYDEHVDKDLCLAIVEALAAGQQENGSWPGTHPVFRKKSVPWHIASHEVALCLSWLYYQPRVPDAARPLIVGMMRKYLLNGVIPTFVKGNSNTQSTGSGGTRLDGWQDDHTVSPDTTVGWATAIVCHFLAGFAHVLNDWINRRVIEELGLQLATKHYLIDDTASSPSKRWARDKDRPLVKQVSEVLRWPMVAVPASSIFEDGFDRMEARATKVFGLLNHLRGCVIFFDEFEEFFLSRGEDEGSAPKTETTTEQDASLYKSRTIAAFTTSAMLPRLQDLHDQDRCLIFLATNYPKKLDSAIKRAGRFDFTITVDHPTFERLQQYLQKLNDKTKKNTGLEEFDDTNIQPLLVAVSEVLKVYEGRGGEKTVKFAIVEEMLRQVRPFEGKELEELKEKATAVLMRQLSASEGGNPPELVDL